MNTNHNPYLLNLPNYRLTAAQWLLRLIVIIPIVYSALFFLQIPLELFIKEDQQTFISWIGGIAVSCYLISGLNLFINQWSWQTNLNKGK